MRPFGFVPNKQIFAHLREVEERHTQVYVSGVCKHQNADAPADGVQVQPPRYEL